MSGRVGRKAGDGAQATHLGGDGVEDDGRGGRLRHPWLTDGNLHVLAVTDVYFFGLCVRAHGSESEAGWRGATRREVGAAEDSSGGKSHTYPCTVSFTGGRIESDGRHVVVFGSADQSGCILTRILTVG